MDLNETSPALDFRTPEWKAHIEELLDAYKAARAKLLGEGNLTPREAALEAMATALDAIGPKIVAASAPDISTLPVPQTGNAQAIRERLMVAENQAFRERALKLERDLSDALEKLSKLES